MRWYVVGQTREGRRFIEGEIARKHLTEDANDNLVTGEEAERDPELRDALADWRAGDDRVMHADQAKWALIDLETPLSTAYERVHEMVMSTGKPGAHIDDEYVKAATELDELLIRASEILGVALRQEQRL